jgi:hypothetical protein
MFNTITTFSADIFNSLGFDTLFMVRQAKLVQASWTIQSGQRLTTLLINSFEIWIYRYYAVTPALGGWEFHPHKNQAVQTIVAGKTSTVCLPDYVFLDNNCL